MALVKLDPHTNAAERRGKDSGACRADHLWKSGLIAASKHVAMKDVGGSQDVGLKLLTEMPVEAVAPVLGGNP